MNGFDLNEHLSNYELQMRGKYRPLPNVIGLSLYNRITQAGVSHFSIVENTLYKSSGHGWVEWWRDWNDRRDMAKYLKLRWFSM